MKKIDTTKIVDSISKGIDKIGKLSKLYRALISLGIIVLLVGPTYWFSYRPKMERITALNNEFTDLDNKLTRLRAKVRQLPGLRARLKEAENEFKIVKKALPEKKEIPTLLASVSRSGQDAGLEFTLFEPKSEINQDFYAEIPVSIEVLGNYHNLAIFFDKVSRLSRIVNIDNINITAKKEEKGGLTLNTSCNAITYQFIEKPPEKK